MKASSSPWPKVSDRASPLATASRAGSNTAPSTHPPDTLPTTSSSGPTAMAAPGPRGAPRLTATTVAGPDGSPAAYRSLSTGRIPRTLRTVPPPVPPPDGP